MDVQHKNTEPDKTTTGAKMHDAADNTLSEISHDHKESLLKEDSTSPPSDVLYHLIYSNDGKTARADIPAGLTSDQVKVTLDNLVAMESVTEVDITQVTDTEWESVTGSLVSLLLKSNFTKLHVAKETVAKVKGKCQGYILDCIKKSAGEVFQVGTKEVKFRDVVDVQKITDKIFGNNKMSAKMVTTIETLNKVDKLAYYAPQFLTAFTKAYKFLKKKRKIRKRDLSVYKTQTVNVNMLPAETLTNAGEDSDSGESEKSHSPVLDEDTQGEGQVMIVPSQSKRCYVCKHRYLVTALPPTPASTQYPRLCPPCATFNLTMRNLRVDFTGKVAVVTGGRIKIGYETVLKLLRDGCQVVTTTRFPNDAAKRYSEETDYQKWGDKLKIYPLDLKDINSIYKFVNYLNASLQHLDILINNAAQTIHRPPAFFQHLIAYEHTPLEKLPDMQRHLLVTENPLKHGSRAYLSGPSITSTDTQTVSPTVTVAMETSISNKGNTPPAVSVTMATDPGTMLDNTNDTQDTCSVTNLKCDSKLATPSTSTPVHVTNEDYDGDTEDEPPIKKLKMSPSTSPTSASNQTSTSNFTNPHLMVGGTKKTLFPQGLLDADGQQVDLRATNSWRAVLDTVPLGEMLEVLMVNTVAPFILNKELKPLMTHSPCSRRFIVNVSAMEGQFNRDSKTRYHPHTNMAKAALNMMTRTAALGYADDGIYMTAVDTGWVTDERPFAMAQHEQSKGFQLPLDCVDGAARVLHPVLEGFSSTKQPHHAVFLKDYKPHPW